MPEFSRTHSTEWDGNEIEVLAIGPYDKSKGTGFTIEVTILSEGRKLLPTIVDSDHSYITADEAFLAGQKLGRHALKNHR